MSFVYAFRFQEIIIIHHLEHEQTYETNTRTHTRIYTQTYPITSDEIKSIKKKFFNLHQQSLRERE